MGKKGKSRNSNIDSNCREESFQSAEDENQLLDEAIVENMMSKYGMSRASQQSNFFQASGSSCSSSAVVNDNDADIEDAIIEVIKTGSFDQLDQLVDVEVQGDSGRNRCLLICVMNTIHAWQGKYMAVLSLLEDMEEEHSSLDEEAIEEMDVEAVSIFSGFSTIVSDLLSRGVDVNTVDDYQWNVLMHASNCGLIELATEILSHKPDLLCYTDSVVTPLTLAVDNNHLALCEFLLLNGLICLVDNVFLWKTDDATEEELYEYHTVLTLSCKLGLLEFVRLLLRNSANVNSKLNDSLDTALHISCLHGKVLIVKELLSSPGIDINALNASGQTAAFGVSDISIIELLVKNGLDISIKDLDGETAASIAEELGDEDVYQFLHALN